MAELRRAMIARRAPRAGRRAGQQGGVSSAGTTTAASGDLIIMMDDIVVGRRWGLLTCGALVSRIEP
jgi:hypothetical protein